MSFLAHRQRFAQIKSCNALNSGNHSVNAKVVSNIIVFGLFYTDKNLRFFFIIHKKINGIFKENLL